MVCTISFLVFSCLCYFNLSAKKEKGIFKKIFWTWYFSQHLSFSHSGSNMDNSSMDFFESCAFWFIHCLVSLARRKKICNKYHIFFNFYCCRYRKQKYPSECNWRSASCWNINSESFP